MYQHLQLNGQAPGPGAGPGPSGVIPYDRNLYLTVTSPDGQDKEILGAKGTCQLLENFRKWGGFVLNCILLGEYHWIWTWSGKSDINWYICLHSNITWLKFSSWQYLGHQGRGMEKDSTVSTVESVELRSFFGKKKGYKKCFLNL